MPGLCQSITTENHVLEIRDRQITLSTYPQVWTPFHHILGL
jgi:hypothetical protein